MVVFGHSAVIHSENEETILKFSEKMKAGRIIVNSPSTHGAIGDIYNTNMPSLTLGCGSFGGNSTTANVSSVNLINIKSYDTPICRFCQVVQQLKTLKSAKFSIVRILDATEPM